MMPIADASQIFDGFVTLQCLVLESLSSGSEESKFPEGERFVYSKFCLGDVLLKSHFLAVLL